ncbi:hypothetical protein GCM10010430_44230 [Kitasatospora cystarginea]|uniref:ABC transporter domain-containing protein n=1 Tax=Kitasatospora cystarginea TaxID=58350 RepID=A0ABN3EF10_9ACTN
MEEDYGLGLGWDAADQEVRAASVRQISARLPGVLGEAFRLAWRVDGRAVVVLLACQVAAGVLQAGGLLATTRAIGVLIGSGGIGSRLDAALPSLLVLACAGGARALLGLTVAALSRRVAPQLTAQAEAMLLEALAGAELVAFEHPGFSDRAEAAERGANTAGDLVSGTQDLIASAASLVGSAFVVSVLHPLLLPLLALGIVPRWISLIRAQHVEYTSYQRSIPDRRMMGALRWYLSDKYPADQVRAGTMAGFLLGRYRHHARLVREREHQAAWQSAKIAAIGSTVAGLSSALLWGALVALLASGHMSLARAGTAVLALQAVSTALWGMVVAAGRLFRTSTYLTSWRSFLEEAAEHRLTRGTTPVVEARVFRAAKITLTYPDAPRPALDGVTFEVRRGEIVGLVGMNGSGKTTLGKCLAGLYLPDSGQVTWDGVDVRDLDPASAWKRVAYVPQQYAKFPVTLEANITLGQPHAGGRPAVLAAAAAAGADRVIGKLRRGLDTLMARAFWGGSGDLSGGEWQRVALSRAFYRPSDLLVMDEPTSALDAEGESRIITGLREQSQGRATVLVTHRLTCLRYVDRVVVLKDGQVAEEGALEELLALGEGGELAKLWALQQQDTAADTPPVGSAIPRATSAGSEHRPSNSGGSRATTAPTSGGASAEGAPSDPVPVLVLDSGGRDECSGSADSGVSAGGSAHEAADPTPPTGALQDRLADDAGRGLRARLVERLETEAGLVDPALRAAFAAVRREIIVPRGYAPRDQVTGTDQRVWQLLDAGHPADRQEWLDLVYSGESLMLHLPDQDPAAVTRGHLVVGGGFASQTTHTTALVHLLQPLALRRGARVLEAGTGAGTVAALLCEITGQEQVTGIEVDPFLARAARERLAAAGYRPRLLTGDALAGCPREEFDAIVLSFSVRSVPVALLEQMAPGGSMVAGIHTGSPSWPSHCRITRTATGWDAVLIPYARGGTAPAAGQDYWRPQPLADATVEADHRRVSRIPVPDRLTDAGFWLAAGHLLGVATGVAQDPGRWMLHQPATGARVLLTDEDGSWQVSWSGRHDLWSDVEELHARWEKAGRPGEYRLDLADPARQTVHAGLAGRGLRWVLPGNPLTPSPRSPADDLPHRLSTGR